MNYRFIVAEARSAFGALWLFSLSVALSILALVSTGGLRQNVIDSLQQQARGLIACDLQVRATHAPSKTVLTAIDHLQAQGVIDHSRIVELFSMVSGADRTRTLLCQIKIVEPSYPWYGEVKLQSGRPVSTVLVSGHVAVEGTLLSRLGLKMGDVLRIGSAQLVISDVVLQEPDRPLAFFSVGPRILMAAADQDSLELVRPGSSISYRQLLRVHFPATEATVADTLRPLTRDDHDQLQTWESAEGQLQRFFDELLRFLATLAVFTMVLAGLSIQSTLSAFINQRRTTLATLKALGATYSYMLRHYSLLVAAFATVGLVVGVSLGLLVQYALPSQLQHLVSSDLQVTWAPVSLAVAIAAGIGVTAIFTRQPLDTLRQIKPHDIFKHSPAPAGRSRVTATTLVAVLFGTLLLGYEVRSLEATAAIAAGVAVLLGVQGLACHLALRWLRTRQIRPLVLRQAVRGLDRPGNQSWMVAVNLATALTVLLTIGAVEANLRTDFLISYPPDSPNIFFIDIQKDQVDRFKAALGMPAEMYPVVRARVASVNGRPITHEDNPEYRKGNLDREARLTYRTDLLDTEHLVGASTMFATGVAGAQVSVVQELAREANLHIGDQLVFNIQGVDIAATVSSIRELTREGIKPAFEFVMDPAALQDAPVTFFTAIQVPPEQVPALQNRMGLAFPNVSSIDVHETLVTLGARLSELDAIVSFFSFLSLVTGVLMMFGSLLSSQAGRLQEAVYFKMLGARRSFVRQVVAIEGLLLGAVASVLAFVLSQGITFCLCRYLLDIDFHPTGSLAWISVGVFPIGISALGLLASTSLLNEKPASYLRQQEDSSG